MSPTAVELETVVGPADPGFVSAVFPQSVVLGTALAGAASTALALFSDVTGGDVTFQIFEVTQFGPGGTPIVVDPADPLDPQPGEAVTVRSRKWIDQLSETGSGSFQMALDDPAASLIPLDGTDRFCIFYFQGAAAWTMLIETLELVSVSQQEHAGELATWSGRGHAAAMEEGLVYPSLGVGRLPIEEDRLFNWASPSYDDTAWGFATEIILMFYARAIWAGLVQTPDPAAQDYNDDLSWVLWDASGTYITALPGQCFFRQTFSVPNDGSYILTFICDDWGSAYLDGAKILDMSTNFIRAQQVRVTLTMGTHLIAANVLNFYLADPAHNPGGFAWNVADDLNGQPGTVHAASSAAARIYPYSDEPPGMAIGKIIRIVFDEAKVRGSWPNGFTLAFDDVNDSLGAPWDLVSDVSTKVGTDLLTFMRELAATYIDFWMDPLSMTLNAAKIGTYGGTPDPFGAGGVFFSTPDPGDPEAYGQYNLLALKMTDQF